MINHKIHLSKRLVWFHSKIEGRLGWNTNRINENKILLQILFQAYFRAIDFEQIDKVISRIDQQERAKVKGLSAAQQRALAKLTNKYQSIFELQEQKRTLNVLVDKGLAGRGSGFYCVDYRLKPTANTTTTAPGKCADCGENDALTGESLCCVCIAKKNENPSCPEPIKI